MLCRLDDLVICFATCLGWVYDWSGFFYELIHVSSSWYTSMFRIHDGFLWLLYLMLRELYVEYHAELFTLMLRRTVVIWICGWRLMRVDMILRMTLLRDTMEYYETPWYCMDLLWTTLRESILYSLCRGMIVLDDIAREYIVLPLSRYDCSGRHCERVYCIPFVEILIHSERVYCTPCVGITEGWSWGAWGCL